MNLALSAEDEEGVSETKVPEEHFCQKYGQLRHD